MIIFHTTTSLGEAVQTNELPDEEELATTVTEIISLLDLEGKSNYDITLDGVHLSFPGKGKSRIWKGIKIL